MFLLKKESCTNMYSIDPAVVDAIEEEREHQIAKWGANKNQTLEGYILILQKELDEAVNGWMKNDTRPRSTALEEIVQVAAVAVACLEQHGVVGNASTFQRVFKEK
jgi:NTP pyrophosphatase (non-canonical NTP hydrolase)